MSAYRSDYYRANAPKLKAASASYRKTTSGRAKANASKRRRRAELKAENPDYYIHRNLQLKFGWTPGDYLALSTLQGGVCAICKKPETIRSGKNGKVQHLAVDHSHKTGKVRGLLCFKCNTVLGKLNDSPELARAVASYLERSL